MKIFTISFLSIFILFVSACESDKKAEISNSKDHFFVRSYVRYLQTEKELKAEISFKKGDTLKTAVPVILDEVIFEGEKVSPQNLGKSYGVRYDFRKRGPYRDQYEFNFRGGPIEQTSHILKMNPITEFLIKEGTINKKEGMTINWKGEALNKDQQMVLLFTDEQKKAFPIKLKGPTQKPEVFIPRIKTKNLTTGKGKLMLIKKQFTETKEGNLTKVSEIEFYSNNLDIEVIE